MSNMAEITPYNLIVLCSMQKKSYDMANVGNPGANCWRFIWKMPRNVKVVK